MSNIYSASWYIFVIFTFSSMTVVMHCSTWLNWLLCFPEAPSLCGSRFTWPKIMCVLWKVEAQSLHPNGHHQYEAMRDRYRSVGDFQLFLSLPLSGFSSPSRLTNLLANISSRLTTRCFAVNPPRQWSWKANTLPRISTPASLYDSNSVWFKFQCA